MHRAYARALRDYGGELQLWMKDARAACKFV